MIIPMTCGGKDMEISVDVDSGGGQDDLFLRQTPDIIMVDRPTAARLAELLNVFAATGKLPDGPPEGVA